MSHPFANDTYRFGSAAFVDGKELHRAGMFTQTPGAVYAGEFDGKPLWYAGDGGILATTLKSRASELPAPDRCGPRPGSEALRDHPPQRAAPQTPHTGRGNDHGARSDVPLRRWPLRAHLCRTPPLSFSSRVWSAEASGSADTDPVKRAAHPSHLGDTQTETNTQKKTKKHG